jgi:hypothetical protein
VLIYWILFAYFAFGALLEGNPQRRAKAPLLLTAGAVFLALLIGFRYYVGGDWTTYQRVFDFAGRASLGRVLQRADPGYQLLNWIIQQFGLRVWAVNLVCGAIFAWGLLRLCRNQPLPWLAFLVAIPYLGIVVGMGYTRQAVAIAILFAGLAAVERGASGLRFAAYVALAATFHRTAVIALPLVVFTGERTRLLNALAVLAISIFLYDLFLANSMGRLFSNYLESELASQGAAVRVALVSIPAAIFLLTRRRLQFDEREYRIWRNFAFAALASLAALFIVKSSTAVDRVSLYFLPLEIVILSRVPLAFRSPILGRLGIILLCASIQFVWLNYAVHARSWVPYRFFPL